MSVSVTCPCGNTVAIAGESGNCGSCSRDLEVYPSIDVARATAEFRENASVRPIPESNLWMVAIG